MLARPGLAERTRRAGSDRASPCAGPRHPKRDRRFAGCYARSHASQSRQSSSRSTATRSTPCSPPCRRHSRGIDQRRFASGSAARSVVEAFNRGDLDVLVATDAAGEGLNLHHRCRLVIDLELPWNPLRLEQRIGRVDRLGQQRRVHAIRLFHPRTVEERVLERLRLRQRRAGLSNDHDSSISEIDVARAIFDDDADRR